VILLDRFAPFRPARRIFAVGAIPLLPFALDLLFFFLAGLSLARRSHRLESSWPPASSRASAGLMNWRSRAGGDRGRRRAPLRRRPAFGRRAPAQRRCWRAASGLLILAILGLGMGALGAPTGRGRPPAAQPLPPACHTTATDAAIITTAISPSYGGGYYHPHRPHAWRRPNGADQPPPQP
jgi:hypothetical protein